MLNLESLRKLFAILLLSLFGFSFASPLVAAAQMGDMKLPACCRKAARHHCAGMDAMAMDGMTMDKAADGESAKPHHDLRARMDCCGCCAFMVASAAHATMLFVVTDLVAPITPRSTRAGLAAQRISRLQPTWQQSGNKRGPPVATQPLNA